MTGWMSIQTLFSRERAHPSRICSVDGSVEGNVSKMSTARVYRDVNATKPKAYWDYENAILEWR